MSIDFGRVLIGWKRRAGVGARAELTHVQADEQELEILHAPVEYITVNNRLQAPISKHETLSCMQ